jgi:pimeloyl-ACP methyl ester carboxylesterase
VDAIGDFRGVPREELQPVIVREASPSFGAAQRRAIFEEMLGAKARPATRAQVLAALGRIDPPAFSALRRCLFQFRDAGSHHARYRGAALAIEAAENPYAAVMASQVLRLQRTEVAGVSHWVQLDEPGAVNRALDAFLAR